METLVACALLVVGMTLVTVWTVNELQAIRHDRNALTVQELLSSQMERLIQAGWGGPGLKPCRDQDVWLPKAYREQLARPGLPRMTRTVRQCSEWLKEVKLRLEWVGPGEYLRSHELVRLVSRREGPRPKDIQKWHESGNAVLLP